ncbi:MAG: hypothetical protein DRR06_02635 [Gammaproteobacteria bacterium]|nr:MAG: hypothetical protein DRR06_02635 [Gammaproteobacteria bacterium]
MTVNNNLVLIRQANVKDLERLFFECFYKDYATVLVGGYSEPLYLPAGDDRRECQLQFRKDFFASALHEIAHWCIAGRERRKLVDFGYWYRPDGRTPAEQKAFELVEVRPQALEWVFSMATGVCFQLSSDNLQAEEPASNGDFADAVYQQVLSYCAQGLPPRGELFARKLAAYYGLGDPVDSSFYDRQILSRRPLS